MDIEEIIQLYKLYGFKIEENNKTFLVFSYSTGYFNNIEILNFTALEHELNECKEKYAQTGYTVGIVTFSDIFTLHNKLFNGFFSVPTNKRKHESEYKAYCQKQTDRMFDNDYEYINCCYVHNSETMEEGLVKNIFENLNQNGPQMIVLEAAAGFGKTCTSYEIYNMFATKKNTQKLPIIAELSRNRKAAIFRYVLLSEIDRNFSNLSSQLVDYEIREGRIPLIIDGFDELLSKAIMVQKTESEQFEDVQTMLDTIADLFASNSKAKVLITSRKSSIFTGEQFENWTISHELDEIISRYEIVGPQAKIWIGSNKSEILARKGINFNYISNPVLLTILRNKDEQYLDSYDINKLLADYLNAILEREKKRQSLSLSITEQKEILIELAKWFAEFNITAEDGDFVKELLSDIVSDKIETYLNRYKNEFLDSNENIPSKEEFLSKLTHHAMLDRIIPGKNLIGFINEFFFGYFLGMALVKYDLNIGFKYIDMISLVYSISGILHQKDIQEKVLKKLESLAPNQQLIISNTLYHCNTYSYSNVTVSSLTFNGGFVFRDDLTFDNCIFTNCTFDNCVISSKSFFCCQFYNCIFYNNTINKDIDDSSELVFLGCNGHEGLATLSLKNVLAVEETDYRKIILEQFWKPGSKSPETKRAFTTIYKGVNGKEAQCMDKALTSLIQENIIIKKSVCYELNFSKLKEVLSILGREINE